MQTEIDELFTVDSEYGEIEPFSLTYSLSNPEEADLALRHIRLWGRLHVRKLYVRETRVLVLQFRPHVDRRWAVWEASRKAAILEDQEGSR